MLYKIVTVYGDLQVKSMHLAYVHVEETGGNWTAEVKKIQTNPIAFTATTTQIEEMTVVAFQKMETEVSIKLSKEIQNFIATNDLEHTIDFVANYGLDVNAHLQIENNAALASQIQLPIIGEFRKMNAILGGNDSLLQVNSLLAAPNQNIDIRKCEAIGLLGALRWREAYNVLAMHTQASKNHIAGSIWLGVEA